MSFSDDGSWTILLSEGERPVLAPEYAVNAPLDAMAEPISYTWFNPSVSSIGWSRAPPERLSYKSIFVQRGYGRVGDLLES
jgi:hypothetical protein